MFWENTKEESVEIKRLNEVINGLKKEIEDIKKDHKKEIEHIKKDNSIIIARKESELDVIISQKTATLKNTIAKLKLENGNYKKEVEILTTAFKNLGFDVKDMKDILNKLVDGIVSKNIVNLIK